MRVITLDSNKIITSVKNVLDNYTLQDGEIISQIGEIGQVQQEDGSFLTPPPSLQETQSSKIQDIQTAYENALSAGFTSSASGTPVKYAYGEKSREAFGDLVDAYKLDFVTYPFNIYSADNETVSITDESQLKQLFADIFAFQYPLKTKQHVYMSQVQSCITVDDVNAIAITF